MKTLIVSVLGVLLLPKIAWAQSVIVPDETLGAERSQLLRGNTVDSIIGGARRGPNLFHSFREFNVGNGNTALFIAPDLNLQNIFARVTGENRSAILGTLATRAFTNGDIQNSSANLFLINPNGILFGPNAQLDVGASLTATTATGVRFGTAGSFDASAPQSPGLLTIQPSAFFFGDRAAAKIEVESNQVLNPNIPLFRGLTVPVGQKFTLLGGDIELRGGQVNALGGRLELGAIGSNSEVFLQDGGALSFPTDGNFQDIKLTDRAFASTVWNGGGEITIMSRNLLLSGVSGIAAGIFPTFGNADTQGGNINAKVLNGIVLEEESFVENNMNPGSQGKAGNLTIETGSLTLKDGAGINTDTSSQGDAGNLNLKVRDKVILDGATSNGNVGSSISSNVKSGASGKGGVVNIEVGSLEVTNGATINTSTFGQGDAGSLTLIVRDKARLNGVAPNGSFGSGVGSIVNLGAGGKGGKVVIDVGNLEITNGATINTTTFGQGGAGSLTLIVQDKARLDGVSPNSAFASGVFSAVEIGAGGNGGQVQVEVGSLEITKGATINAGTFGAGNAGNINLIVKGKARLDGESPDGAFGSGIFSAVNLDAEGNGGEVKVEVGSLEVTNGATINVNTSGAGNAGNLTLIVRDKAILDGTTPNKTRRSGIGSDVNPRAVGQGGQVLVKVGSIELTNGAIISTSTLGDGDAGDISIVAQKEIILRNSTDGIESSIRALSKTERLTGNIVINTPSLRLDRSEISVEADSVNGGKIFIGTKPDTPQFEKTPLIQPTIVLRNGSLISSTAGDDENPGNGGNINIDSRIIVAIPKENSDISANAFKGNGGKIDINSKGVFGFLIANKSSDKPTLQSDIIASSTEGITGTISVTTPDNSAIQNNLAQLTSENINPDRLVAQTCLVRQNTSQQGSFYASGNTNLANTPTDINPSTFATAPIQTSTQQAATDRPWKLGDPIVEPQGFYKLADGRLVMGRECSQ